MLLLVNPNDESSLRMSAAYAKARAIPDRNILYIAPPRTAGYDLNQVSYTTFTSTYVNAVPAAIAARGLTGQIDYIGSFGQPQVVWGNAPTGNPAPNDRASIKYGFDYAVSLIPKFQAGMYYPTADYRVSELFQTTIPYVNHDSPPSVIPAVPYTKGSNAAIDADASGRFIAGNVGYSGTFGITTQHYLDMYLRSVAGDGTRPEGKVYFIENDGIRSTTREPYWKSVQQYMTANGIPWEENRQLYDGSPSGKPDVRGAVVGSAGYDMPNGSTYLPGSWGDSLTSSGGAYSGSAQTKADKFIRSGASGTSGSVSEPYAIADRFPNAMLFVYNDEGSTLGEAFAKSVRRPDMMMFQGDLLSQAYADVPTVTLSSAPPDAAPVTGTVSIGASAVLNSPKIATGIAKLLLYVDGLEKGVITSSDGTFNLDTTTLSDGLHEIRVVAVNDSQAASRGYTRSTINVVNNGQSVIAAGSTINASHDQVVSIPVTAIAGTGPAVSRVELRSFGRVVGMVSGSTGSVDLNAELLAFGDNTITPVAVLANGSEVAGATLTVNRDFNRMAGVPVTPEAERTPGFKFEYFENRAGNTLADTSFVGAPDQTLQGTILSISPEDSVNIPASYQGGNNGGLAIRVTSRMRITEEGEYGFFFDAGDANFEGLQFSIDGQIVLAHEYYIASTGKFLASKNLPGVQSLRSVYLLPGEHTIELLLANPVAEADTGLATNWWYRGPSGDTETMSGSAFYTVVPEPTSALLFGIGAGSLILRRRRRA
jgi:hypothetical protein